jgi:FkbM family methyltransferase
MKTVKIKYAGHTVALPDMPEYAKFYRKLAAGTWEPRTFEVLARNLDSETVYVDIGAWIGVTPFWASHLAKSVVAIEPDPKCCEILRALSPGHANVTVLEGALSAGKIVTVHAVGDFGSSETSMLAIGDGSSVEATGFTINDIMRHAGRGPVFVKIDIEGYEYLCGAELAKLEQYRLKGLQIAVHPMLYERSLQGIWLVKRLRTAWKTWKLSRIFYSNFGAPTIVKHGGILRYVVFGIMLSKRPRGTDFVFERKFLEGKRAGL